METNDPSVFYEDLPLYRLRLRNDPSMQFMRQVQDSKSISMFGEYSRSVTQLCLRNLSFQGDILDASAGLLRSLKSTYTPNPYPLTYYFGIPSAWFEESLCWTPFLRSKVKRRDAICRDRASGIQVPFPSWSWTGWVGRVEYAYVESYSKSFQSEVEWYKFDNRGEIIKLQIGEDPPAVPPVSNDP